MYLIVCLPINEVIYMLIQSCIFTIHFPPNLKVRERLFQLESHFEDFQKPFTLVPLPPEAPMELPRIIAISQYGHSQLTICGSNIQLATTFDENYSVDVAKCIEYVRSRYSAILSALPIINENTNAGESPNFYFSGLSMIISMDESDGIKNPPKYIAEKFLKCTTNLLTDEIQFRFALVVNDAYYVNLMVQNNRQYTGRPDERGSIADLKIAKETLQVALDVNDRYAFNHIKNYASTSESVDCIAKLVEKFAAEYVVDFVANGEIKYDEQ